MTLLEELFRKYIREEITPAELEQLRLLATREENREELDRLLVEHIEQDFPTAPGESGDAAEELDVDGLYRELTDKYNIPVVMEGGRSRRPLLLLAMISAAACLLILIGARFLWKPAVKAPAPVAAKMPVKLLPAGNKAVLTLAGGGRIVLDSASNGMLAKQGGTAVVKLKDGQLAYQAGMGMSETGAGVKGGEDLFNEISTPRGGFYQLTLPDGSKVWLDAASTLRFPTAFTGKDRTVELNGEAYFEVEPDAGKPFRVKTGAMAVNVLGTSLNIMAYTDEDAIRTTLITGAIQVATNGETRLARPGEQLSYVRNTGVLQVSKPDLRQVLAWKQGEFRFDGLPITAIMRQIARWYDVDVEFRGPQPTNEFSGVIPRKKEASELLTVLEQTDEVRFTVEGRKIVVTKP